jgi:peptide-methionine (S)-S-oxide reductase
MIEKATFAAGCFWGIENAFRQLPGVIDAVSGYTGGKKDNPTYKEVCTGKTGHAEAVEVTYDPEKISYGDLLHAFWVMHNPTQVDRQGPDFGTQYRSAIFCHGDAQMEAAKISLAQHQKRLSQKIATQIVPAATFWPAEEYHQRYVEKHGGGVCHI